MPSKKKKYNARFPAGRIKKIMQSDEEIGKVAQAVPVIISRTLELFVESLLKKTTKITNSRNARTLSPSHLKQCIISENKFDFLKDLVKNIPDISSVDEGGFDEPGSSSTANSNEHQDTTNIIQSVRHHLQRSQSLGFAGTQSLNSIQKPVYPDNNHPLALKRKFSGTERPAATTTTTSTIPYKITRLNSSPATSTITSSNYLNDASASSSLASNSNHQFLTPPVNQTQAASFKIEIKSPDANSHANNNFSAGIQISYCMDSANKTNHTNSTNSTSNSISSTTITPIPDYSKLTMPMTSATIPTALSSCSPTLATSPGPFKIDLSNFSPMTPQPIQLSQNQNQQLEAELDENYDDL